MHSTLIVYPDGPDKPSERFDCVNGFVSNVVSAIANNDHFGCIPDAHRVCKILNNYFRTTEVAS